MFFTVDLCSRSGFETSDLVSPTAVCLSLELIAVFVLSGSVVGVDTASLPQLMSVVVVERSTMGGCKVTDSSDTGGMSP